MPYNSTSPPLIKALTKDEKDKVRAVHVNMGHLPQNQMLALLKAAGAKQHEATAFCQSKKSRFSQNFYLQSHSGLGLFLHFLAKQDVGFLERGLPW